MEHRYQIGNEVKTVRVEREGDVTRVSIDNATHEAQLTRVADGVYDLHVDGRIRRVYLVRDGTRRLVALGSDVYELQSVERTRTRAATHGDAEDTLAAQMPGQVVSVAVQAGDAVTKGQTLVILEAMKMELRVQAPHEGTVKRVLVAQGQVVERGQQLVELGASS